MIMPLFQLLLFLDLVTFVGAKEKWIELSMAILSSDSEDGFPSIFLRYSLL